MIRNIMIASIPVDSSRENPLREHTWRIWREGGTVVAESDSKAPAGKNHYEFSKFAEQDLLLLGNTTDNKWAKVRSHEFETWLNANGIKRFVHADPNETFSAYSMCHGQRLPGKISWVTTDGKCVNQTLWDHDMDTTDPNDPCYGDHSCMVMIKDATFKICDGVLTSLLPYDKINLHGPNVTERRF